MTSDDQFPTNFHVLRPRQLTLADRLDQFLEEHALDSTEAPVRSDPTRPKSVGVNALTCAACGQAEYITRNFCRCGHYLRGQLEDEFLAWETQVQADHDQLVDSVAAKLKPLRYLFALSLPFLVLPLMNLAFWSDGLSIYPLIWMMAGIALAGAAAIFEKILCQPLKASDNLLSTYTFETFIEDRFLRKAQERICCGTDRAAPIGSGVS